MFMRLAYCSMPRGAGDCEDLRGTDAQATEPAEKLAYMGIPKPRQQDSNKLACNATHNILIFNLFAANINYKRINFILSQARPSGGNFWGNNYF